MSYALDITDRKEGKRETLGEAVVNMVKETQRVVIRDYPDRLIMTRAQYNLLAGLPEGDQRKQTLRFFRNKYNVMEVVIDETRTSDNLYTAGR